ncbi:hypothetical protein DSO57_1031515 [Entomophthora muscae]|uniref:Uncharacterized protein n=1 Tax=Entomophthora muscae TaxID=34485 RepID=A0ACC2ULK0_9FUNG|nr:hypothetical protein DSO57_1031515 [Entomophthora muscae]
MTQNAPWATHSRTLTHPRAGRTPQQASPATPNHTLASASHLKLTSHCVTGSFAVPHVPMQTPHVNTQTSTSNTLSRNQEPHSVGLQRKLVIDALFLNSAANALAQQLTSPSAPLPPPPVPALPPPPSVATTPP